MNRELDHQDSHDTRGRRAYLKAVGGASGIGVLGGCIGISNPFRSPPDFEPEQVTSELGALVPHNMTGISEKAIGEGDDYDIIDSGNENVSLENQSGVLQSVSISSSVSPGDGPHERETTIAGCSMVSRETFWEAPNNGTFEINVDFDVSGTVRTRFDCHGMTSHHVMSTAATQLVVFKNPEDEAGRRSLIHTTHRDSSDGGDWDDSVETVLEALLRRIVRSRLGLSYAILATPIIGAVVDWGSFVADVVSDAITGSDCYTEQSRDSFDDPDTSLSTRFSAEEGDIFKIVFLPMVGNEFSFDIVNSSNSYISSNVSLSEFRINAIE